MGRLCRDCPRIITSGTRCPDCNRAHSRHKRRQRPDLHSTTYQHKRRALIDAHILLHGQTCPGDTTHPEHPVAHKRDLTIDHINPDAPRGDASQWRIICRQANSSKGARHNGS